jgi:hypothetical protein
VGAISRCFGSLFSRPNTTQVDQELLDRAVNLIVEHVPQVVADARIADRAFCVLLGVYNQNFMPPKIGVGLEDERERLAAAYPDDAGTSIWNPDEYKHYFVSELRERSKELADLSDEINRTVDSAFDREPWDMELLRLPKQLCNQAAERLARQDWSPILNTTEDFVVVAATIYECEDVGENMKFSVSPELQEHYRQRGWLPSA